MGTRPLGSRLASGVPRVRPLPHTMDRVALPTDHSARPPLLYPLKAKCLENAAHH